MLYKISMNKSDFFKLHNKISTKNLAINDDYAEFEVELGAYNIIKESGYEYKLKESLKTKILLFIRTYYLVITGVLFLFSILYINSYRVSKIHFNIDTPINSEIESEITSNYKKLFSFNFVDINYTELSKKLQRKYIEYPYIAVYTSNNDIKVDIYKEDEYPMISHVEYGNIVAKKDAIVEDYYVYNGINNVHKNKYVKKGDVLISASAYKGGQGMILGYVYEKIIIDIPCKEEIIDYTSQTQKYNTINIFKKEIEINKDELYENYDKTNKILFNFFDIFTIKEIEEKEKNAIIKEYTEADAKEIAINKIKESFNNNKISDLEQIIDIYDYSTKQKNDNYQCTFIVKKLESIGELVVL